MKSRHARNYGSSFPFSTPEKNPPVNQKNLFPFREFPLRENGRGRKFGFVGSPEKGGEKENILVTMNTQHFCHPLPCHVTASCKIMLDTVTSKF